MSISLTRREFIYSSAGLSLGSLLSGCSFFSSNKLKLGFDNFSIRALKLKAPALLEYAAQQKVDALLLSDLDVFENYDESYLSEIRQQAEELEIEVHLGTGSICPTSHSFKKNKGSAEEQLSQTIKLAAQIGSPVARCYLGTSKDRLSPGGLKKHMNAIVKVCQNVSELAREHEITIAIENHAGDLTARQLKDVIERAGADYVGATIDSGNATWTMEDPYQNLKILAPYVACSGIRDSLVYDQQGDIKATWTAMGQGNVDWPLYFSHWQQHCPDVPVFMEIISGLTKSFPPPSDEKFWAAYQDINSTDYENFKAMTKKGNKKQLYKAYKNLDRKVLFSADYMKSELEDSLNFSRNILGIGRKS